MNIIAKFLALIALAAAPVSAQEVEPVTLIIDFETNDEGLAEFAAIMDGVSEGMASEEGFVSASVYRDVDNPHRFVLIEVWASKDLHLAHFDRINESGDWDHIRTLLTRDPVMGYFRAPAD